MANYTQILTSISIKSSDVSNKLLYIVIAVLVIILMGEEKYLTLALIAIIPLVLLLIFHFYIITNNFLKMGHINHLYVKIVNQEITDNEVIVSELNKIDKRKHKITELTSILSE